MSLKAISIFFSLAIILSMETNFAYPQNPESLILTINSDIETSMTLFLEDIPEEQLINYGIKDKSELYLATMGEPVAIYTIEADSIVFTNTWRVPLVIDNEYRALFTIFKTPYEEYKIADFGATLLADVIYQYRKENDLTSMLRVYKLSKDYFISENSQGEFRFQPVPNQEKKQYSLNDIIELTK